MNEALIKCPNCDSIGSNQILGSVTEEGFIIRRYNHKNTLVMAQSYVIKCDCGYTLAFDGTVRQLQ